MSEESVIPKSIVDKIYEGFIERIRDDESFDKEFVNRISELSQNGGLKSAELIENSLSEEDDYS